MKFKALQAVHVWLATNRPAVVAVLAAVALVLSPSPATAEVPSIAEVERAVLAGQWTTILQLLRDVDTSSPNPVLRLVKGHACLATNYNDNSYCMFRTLAIQNDLQQCLAWADSLVNRAQDGKAAMAHYLRGDILARSGRLEEAVACFDEAHRLRADNPLILNARGVAYACRGDLDAALCDLDEATRMGGSLLADPHANLAALAIQSKEGAEEAVQDFEAAIKASHGFSLACYGRGCVRCMLGEPDQGMKDIEKAIAGLACGTEDLRANLAIAYDTLLAMAGQDARVAASGRTNPQMAIDAQLNALKQGASPEGFLGQGPGSPINQMFYEYRNSGYDSQVREHMTQGLAEVMKEQPGLAPGIMRQLDHIHDTNNLANQMRDMFPTAVERTHEMRADAHLKAGTEGVYGAGAGAAAGGPGVGAAAGAGILGKYDASAGAGGELTIRETLTPGSLPFTQQHREFAEMSRAMQNELSESANVRTQPQGFKTASDSALWDHGDWPFSPLYGLRYVKAKDPR